MSDTPKSDDVAEVLLCRLLSALPRDADLLWPLLGYPVENHYFEEGPLEPLRAPVFSRPTPFVGGDAAVIDDEGRILLIQRADNGKWAMPGGALEVGETPAQGVLREVMEETGVRCQAVALLGVFDSRLCGLASRHHIYLLTFLCQPVEDADLSLEVAKLSHAREVLQLRWFTEHTLPDDLHPGTALRLDRAYRLWRDGVPAYFDGLDEAGC